MKKRIFTAIILVFWAVAVISQNNVGIGTAAPAAKLDVRGNGIGYDVFNASNDKDVILDSIMSLSSMGHLGIGTTNTGNYKLISLGRPSAFSPQIEVWQGHPNLGGTLLGEINDVAGSNGCLNLYLAGVARNVQLRAQGISYFNGGRVGIGLTTPAALLDVSGQGTAPGDIFWAGNDRNTILDSSMVLTKNGNLGIGLKIPNERLHLNGAIVVGQSTAAIPVAGTIEWNGTNFLGLDAGGTWVNLDAQPIVTAPIWLQQVGSYLNPELFPSAQPASISMAPAGAPNQGGMVWLPDLSSPALFPHQLMLESTSALQTNASMLYRLSAWTFVPPSQWVIGLINEYSLGAFKGDLSFKLFKGPALGPTSQGDGTTMLRANQSGIIDFPNNSRVRAYQVASNGFPQLIPANMWTPVNFTNDFPLPQGYDQQNEFTPAVSANQPTQLPIPMENAFFTAFVDGYYQVNARCEFDTYYCHADEYYEWPGGNVVVNSGSYVSIAIYKGFAPPAAGGATSYSIGNNLQIGYLYISPLGEDITGALHNNNAPNLSDVVFMMAGQTISIWVYHTANTPMNLIPGPDRLYVSIHKVS